MTTLPDRPCRPGGVLLVGINPAPVSVLAGHYYQGAHGKRLWKRLARLGLLAGAVEGNEDDAFVAAGNGLTDLVKRPSKAAAEVSPEEMARSASSLHRDSFSSPTARQRTTCLAAPGSNPDVAATSTGCRRSCCRVRMPERKTPFGWTGS
jgi:uracil DNA glycosylase superfamily protein